MRKVIKDSCPGFNPSSHPVSPVLYRRVFERVLGSGFLQELMACGLKITPSVWTSGQLGHPLAIKDHVRNTTDPQVKCLKRDIMWLQYWGDNEFKERREGEDAAVGATVEAILGFWRTKEKEDGGSGRRCDGGGRRRRKTEAAAVEAAAVGATVEAAAVGAAVEADGDGRWEAWLWRWDLVHQMWTVEGRRGWKTSKRGLSTSASLRQEEAAQTFFNEMSARKQTVCEPLTSSRVCVAQT
ncbi:hypothetical protein E3N88_30928 [Mikania micrantha]|uniref:Uncharacterized protein n=1 Tax=Mikania micrantha TaxID=192012 RepID=A0A5N6MQZ6_9ASTR|nr:hypothetical protein E3N88_30928 [Mikania micrantha]